MKNPILILVLGLTLFSCKKDEAVTPSPPPPPPADTSLVNLPEEFAALEGLFNGNGIGAAVNITEDIILFFNMDGDKYAWFEDNEVHLVKNINDADGHFSNFALDNIGAATLFNGTSIYMFDNSGINYQTMTFDLEDVDEGYIDNDVFAFSASTHQLYEWGPDNTCPFSSISAILNYSKPNACFDATEDVIWTAMINGAGNEYVWYEAPTGGLFHSPEEIENWVFENMCNGPDGLLPFDAISAACRYVKPNGIQELFFDEDGKTFTIQNVSEGIFSEIYSLY